MSMSRSGQDIWVFAVPGALALLLFAGFGLSGCLSSYARTTPPSGRENFPTPAPAQNAAASQAGVGNVSAQVPVSIPIDATGVSYQTVLPLGVVSWLVVNNLVTLTLAVLTIVLSHRREMARLQRRREVQP